MGGAGIALIVGCNADEVVAPTTFFRRLPRNGVRATGIVADAALIAETLDPAD